MKTRLTFPIDKILDQSKLKVIADEKVNEAQNLKFC